MSVLVGVGMGNHKLKSVTEPHGIGRVFDCDWTGGVCDSPCKDIK